MNSFVWKSRAAAKTNGDFISIKAFSGYRLALADPTCPESLLPPDASDDILGTAVLEALAQSRHLSLAEAEALRAKVEEDYEKNVAALMERYAYRTRQKLFKEMRNCGIESSAGVITIRPTNHEKLEGWSGDGIDKSDYVNLSANSPTTEIGAALRLAFSRCKG